MNWCPVADRWGSCSHCDEVAEAQAEAAVWEETVKQLGKLQD